MITEMGKGMKKKTRRRRQRRRGRGRRRGERGRWGNGRRWNTILFIWPQECQWHWTMHCKWGFRIRVRRQQKHRKTQRQWNRGSWRWTFVDGGEDETETKEIFKGFNKDVLDMCVCRPFSDGCKNNCQKYCWFISISNSTVVWAKIKAHSKNYWALGWTQASCGVHPH